jgi:NADH dehydrogenase
MSEKIVIVGAGYAGIEAALKLYKKGRKEKLHITIVDRNPYHTLLTEIHEVAGNRVSEEAVTIPLKDIFKNTHVRVAVDNIEKFDFEKKVVSSKEHKYPYDYLILAFGSTPNYFGIPGLEKNGFPLWSLNDAVRIRNHVEDCFIQAETEKDPAKRKRLLTFVVGGAGFTGVEMVGELAHWVRELRRRYNIDRREVRLILVDMLQCILTNLCTRNSKKARDYLVERLHVEVLLETPVKQLTEEYVELGDKKIPTATLIWAAGVRSSLDTEKTGLETGPAKRIKVDEYCRTKYWNVFAIGDVGALSDTKGKPYPPMVETALQTAAGAAENILRAVRGKPPEPVRVKLHGVMVSVGNYFAVADLSGMRPPSWISLVMKYIVNAHYLYGILGVKGPWDYLRDEILHRRQHKRFFQRNYTKKMQVWWAVPLRLYLGWAWFYEGLKKIWDGWFVSAKLASFLGVTATTGVNTSAGAEAVSQASPAAAAQGPAVLEKLMNIDLGFIKFLFERSGPSAPLVFRIDFSVVNWIIKGWVLSTEAWSMFFQIFIVILELLVGVAIFTGTFTFLASIVSLALLAMFVTTTGLYDTTWWMVFAAIAAAGGLGRAFGLDHYILPYLARVWDAARKNGRLILRFNRGQK